MKLFKNTWFRTMFNKDQDKTSMKDNSKIPKNIYGSTKANEHQKRFHLIHYVFKYKFAVPLIFLAKKILNKHLVKKVPKGSHNTNLRLFNEAYKEAVHKWVHLCLRNTGPKENRMTKRQCNQREKNDAYLHTLKELVNTLYIHDTAYRNFVDILMHEITKSMIGHYSKYPDKKTNHLFHTVDMYEVNYFVLEKIMRYNVELRIENAYELAKQLEKKIDTSTRKNKKKQ
jgi:hypothetical protein